MQIPTRTSTYSAEVIEPGDRASKLAKEVCSGSFKNNEAVQIHLRDPERFRASISYIWRPHILHAMLDGDMVATSQNDGAGGKPQFFSLLGEPLRFAQLGWEIVTMTADDFARHGQFPVLIDNEINVKQLTEQNFHLFEAMIKGYGHILGRAGLINITGEVAVMRDSITAFCDTGDPGQLILTWGASCHGLAHSDAELDPSDITPGMTVVGLHDPGFRCNGAGFFVKLIRAKWGSDPRKLVENAEVHNLARSLVVPSVSYARLITDLLGWQFNGIFRKTSLQVYAAAHITGGGLWGKFGELLPQGVGAKLDNMPYPNPALRAAYELSQEITALKLTPWQMYQNFHGGCGMLLVCHSDSATQIITAAQSYGCQAQVVGETVESPDQEVRVKSRFGSGQWLSSLDPQY